jgi:ribosome biogenesis GTPase A
MMSGTQRSVILSWLRDQLTLCLPSLALQEETVLKGAVRAERLEAPQDFIPEILSRVQRKYVERHYSIKSWTDVTDFLTQLAYLMGKLVKGGEPDLNNVSIQVINDFQRVCAAQSV